MTLVTVLIDGVAAGPAVTVAANGTWSFTPATALSNASHSVSATEVNAAGTSSTASAADTFTVNTATPPAPVIAAPANGVTIANGHSDDQRHRRGG